MTYTFEICIDSVQSAINAQQGGAQRVELCDNLVEGGTTPSAGMVAAVRELDGLDVMMMIRPRGGDFCYDANELDVMQRDIDMAKQLGVDGIVLGILTPEGRINVEDTRRLVERARPLQVTFHRAFDVSEDPYRALDDLLAIGVDRLLTSGQQRDVIAGLDLITELVRRAGDDLIVMPGGGINPNTVRQVAEQSGAKEFHFSARMQFDGPMVYRKEGIPMGEVAELPEFSRTVSDLEIIRQTIASAG